MNQHEEVFVTPVKDAKTNVAGSDSIVTHKPCCEVTYIMPNKTRSPASAGIANRPLRTTLSGHNIEYLCLNLFTLRRFNNNESSGGRQIRFLPLLGVDAPRLG